MKTRKDSFAEFVFALSADEFAMLEKAVAGRRCKEEIGFADFDELAAEYRPLQNCPECESDNCRKDGRTQAGHQRFRCKKCGRRFSAMTGTVFEHSKSDLATWVEFIRLMCYNVPLDAAAGICRITHKTAYEWRHRVMASVGGYQNRLVLGGRVWVDETYVADRSLLRGPMDKIPRGLSGKQICISVAIDAAKNAVAIECGHGKPSSKRIKDALGLHIAKGSTVVHDREKSHNGLLALRECISEAYKADSADPVYLEKMALINNFCSWIKRYLWRFPGMKPKNLQSYLNWFAYLFRVKRDEERWPKTERVLRHLMLTETRYRSS